MAHPRDRPATRFPPASADENGPRLAARTREAGAFVAIAHPAWSQLTIEDGRALAAAHAVEIYNHGSAVEADRGDGFYLLDQLCNEDRRLTAIATDDAHFRHGDYDAFGGFVMVKSESLDPDGLLNALKAGEFYSSRGPRLHNIEVSRNEAFARHWDLARPDPCRARRHRRDDRNRPSLEKGVERRRARQMVPHRHHRRSGTAGVDQSDLGRHVGLTNRRFGSGSTAPLRHARSVDTCGACRLKDKRR